MRREPWGLYAIAAAILVVGLTALGVPAGTLLFGAFVLVCPLMMLFMMAGMHGARGGDRNTGHGGPANQDRNRGPIVRR